jgi:hypothetical protein
VLNKKRRKTLLQTIKWNRGVVISRWVFILTNDMEEPFPSTVKVKVKSGQARGVQEV